jgi:hypothetical protein
MRIVGGLDVHRRQITFDYLDEHSGQCRRGRIAPADRMLLRRWLATNEVFSTDWSLGAGENQRCGGDGADALRTQPDVA